VGEGGYDLFCIIHRIYNPTILCALREIVALRLAGVDYKKKRHAILIRIENYNFILLYVSEVIDTSD
jgi:hypothetical protein